MTPTPTLPVLVIFRAGGRTAILPIVNRPLAALRLQPQGSILPPASWISVSADPSLGLRNRPRAVCRSLP